VVELKVENEPLQPIWVQIKEVIRNINGI